MVKNKVLPIPLASIDSATFTGAYQLLTTLAQPCVTLQIVNNSDRDITVSYDGTIDHDFIQDTKERGWAFQNNAQPANFVAILAKNTKVYVKGSAGGTGLVTLSGWYSPQGL